MLLYHYLMLHFKVNQSLYSQQNQTTPLRGKFQLICNWPGQFQKINCSNLLTLRCASAHSICHECSILSITTFNQAQF